jgi:hypothetical protein
MKRLNKHSFTRTCIYSIVSAAFIGCGGGGTAGTTTTSASSTSSSSTSIISGTVPGTLIEAFCQDGSYYKVNSTNNGTNNHPFELEIPNNLDCKLVMTTNENDADITKRIVTPLMLSDGVTTSTYFQVSENSDIGYIGLPLSGQGIQPLINISTSGTKLKINSFSYDPLDSDNDGIPNVYEDDDGDGKYNKDDDDDDNDGIKDSLDDNYKDDTDGDGIKNQNDKDDDNDGINDTSNTSTGTTITLPSSYTQNNGRLLGSQCSQCHGTNGNSVNSWDSIAGENDLLDEIHDDNPIMSAQAKGYTNTEINLIGTWLSSLQSNED